MLLCLGVASQSLPSAFQNRPYANCHGDEVPPMAGLTGYAVTFNRRHRRQGHLFQNRYKSILCQEEVYLKELVRYIHLNPLRAKIVSDLDQLDTYAFCGHSALMNRVKRSWQEVDEVLGLFGETHRQARRRYRSFVKKGIEQGRRKDLTAQCWRMVESKGV
jgi:hypothetical protein